MNKLKIIKNIVGSMAFVILGIYLIYKPFSSQINFINYFIKVVGVLIVVFFSIAAFKWFNKLSKN